MDKKIEVWPFNSKLLGIPFFICSRGMSMHMVDKGWMWNKWDFNMIINSRIMWDKKNVILSRILSIPSGPCIKQKKLNK